MNRREFIGGAVATLAAGYANSGVNLLAQGAGDLRAAFRALGFDMDADGASWFALTADVHTCQPLGKGKYNHDHFAAHVAAWNAEKPRPTFVGVLGDLANLNEFFGHRPGLGYSEEKAAEGYGTFKRILDGGLDPSVRRVLVIGNHDTYPGERDRALWRKHFPDQPPYCACDLCGIRVLKWDGGGDAVFDDAQKEWIRAECAKVPKDKPLVILVHQPAVGLCGRERDIGIMAKEALAGRTGQTWIMAGHEHSNRLERWTLPGGGMLAVATHAKDVKGWWAYGVRNGEIVARVFWNEQKQAFEPGEMPSDLTSRGEIPTAYHDRTDVVWSAFVGSEEERACRRRVSNTGDNVGWFYYVGTLLHCFPKARIAPTATRLAILGEMPGKRMEWTPSPCFVSVDGRNWRRLARTKEKNEVFSFALPPDLVGAKDLYVEYDGYGMDCDDCIAGFAFLQ